MGKSEDKKSFQLYNDYIDHFSLMSDEEAGKLIRQISKYRWHPFLKVMEMLPAQ